MAKDVLIFHTYLETEDLKAREANENRSVMVESVNQVVHKRMSSLGAGRSKAQGRSTGHRSRVGKVLTPPILPFGAQYSS